MVARISFVINWFNGGGIDNYVLDYLNYYDRSRYAVDILCVGKSMGKNVFLATSLKTNVSHVPKSSMLLSYKKRLSHFFKNNHYDIVLSHLNEMSGLVLDAAALKNIRHRVAVMHSTRCSSLL